MKIWKICNHSDLKRFKEKAKNVSYIKLRVSKQNAPVVIDTIAHIVKYREAEAKTYELFTLPKITLKLSLQTQEVECTTIKYETWAPLFELRMIEMLIFVRTPATFRLIFNNLPPTHGILGLVIHHVYFNSTSEAKPMPPWIKYLSNKKIRHFNKLAITNCGLVNKDVIQLLTTATEAIMRQNECLEKKIMYHRTFISSLNVEHNQLTVDVLPAVLDYALLRLRTTTEAFFSFYAKHNAFTKTDVIGDTFVTLHDMLQQYKQELFIEIDADTDGSHEEEESDASVEENSEDALNRHIEAMNLNLQHTYSFNPDVMMEITGEKETKKKKKEKKDDSESSSEEDEEMEAAEPQAEKKDNDKEQSNNDSVSSASSEEDGDELLPPPVKKQRTSEHEAAQLEKDARKYLNTSLSSSMSSSDSLERRIHQLTTKLTQLKETPDAMKQPGDLSLAAHIQARIDTLKNELNETTTKYVVSEVQEKNGIKPLSASFNRQTSLAYDNQPFLRSLIKICKDTEMEECKICHLQIIHSEMKTHMNTHAAHRTTFQLISCRKK